jgi:hypothetical protein
VLNLAYIYLSKSNQMIERSQIIIKVLIRIISLDSRLRGRVLPKYRKS